VRERLAIEADRFSLDGLDETPLDPRPQACRFNTEVLCGWQPGRGGSCRPQGVPGVLAGRAPGRDLPSGAAGPAGPGGTCGPQGLGGNGDQPQGFQSPTSRLCQPQTAAGDAYIGSGRWGDTLYVWMQAPGHPGCKCRRDPGPCRPCGKHCPAGSRSWKPRCLASFASWRCWQPGHPGPCRSAGVRCSAPGRGTGCFVGTGPALLKLPGLRSLVILLLDTFTGEVYPALVLPPRCAVASSLDALPIRVGYYGPG